MPFTVPSGEIAIRRLADDVVVLSLDHPGLVGFNVTGHSLSNALSELSILVAAMEGRRHDPA